jgi:formylglycine-generating enzyme required for sulfatase activity
LGFEFSFPTEAQWEYACRAGNGGLYGLNDTLLYDLGWYSGNSDDRTHPVAKKKPNAWGLYDMHGNVQEWCADGYGVYPSSEATDPIIIDGGERVIRGGCYRSRSQGCRSAGRSRGASSEGYRNCGLRLVLSKAGKDQQESTIIF